MFERVVSVVSQTRDTTSSPVKFTCEVGKSNYNETRFLAI